MKGARAREARARAKGKQHRKLAQSQQNRAREQPRHEKQAARKTPERTQKQERTSTREGEKRKRAAESNRIKFRRLPVVGGEGARIHDLGMQKALAQPTGPRRRWQKNRRTDATFASFPLMFVLSTILFSR